MNPLEERLRHRIRTEGPITFADFMSAALYDPQCGYYAAGPPRTGWDGHFVTSSELHPLFGELWARFFHRVWVEAGRPSRFRIVEIGPGEGAFAHALLKALPADLAEVSELELIEPFSGPRRRQMRRLEPYGRVHWHSSVAEVERGGWGCVFANEVLDNLPVHLVTAQGGRLRELWVEVRDGFQLVPGEPSSPALAEELARLGIEPAEGEPVEVCLELSSFVADAARCLDQGTLVFVDYGVTVADLGNAPRSTLAAYSAIGADAETLREPGTRDVTAHVVWDALLAAVRDEGWEPAGPVAQGDFLRALGLAELERATALEHRRALARGDGRAAVRALSRRGAAGALTSPAGLGALGVCLGTRGLRRAVASLNRGP